MVNGTLTSPSTTHEKLRSTPSFRHEPLDRRKRSFRLIKVLRDRSDDGLLQLSLWHDSISTSSYQCLSYRWGDRPQCHTVLINGAEFRIGENLYHFLAELHATVHKSTSETSEALWIDSICINQTSIMERGHQVQHMGTIYATAKEVLVWLGNENLSYAMYEWIQAEPRKECPATLHDRWNRIRYNPYWCRAWIVQEILLAAHVTVLFPAMRLDYARLGRAITRSADLNRLEEEVAAQLWTFWCERWKKPAHHKHKPKTLDWIRHQHDSEGFWTLIQMHKAAKCTDERDRIYSLLGLINGGHQFRVDYDESAAELFWRVGEHFDAWEAPELVDILRVALGKDKSSKSNARQPNACGISPWVLVDALRKRSGLHVQIPVRRATPTTSLFCRVTRRIRCDFKDCRRAPPLRCTRNDILLCTNAKSSGPTEHGCLHGLARPLDRPAAEPFEIKLEAHHGATVAKTTLPPTALRVFDAGTDSWVGISTWSSLRKALDRKDLDRADRVKLQVPAEYAIWIWFGIHPAQLDSALDEHLPELPSAHHALPPGTKVTRGSIEVPSAAIGMKGETPRSKEGIFNV
jgi:hypothetical protein